MKRSKGPKILIFDIETKPLEAWVWGLWENNVALNQIKSDWSVLSWAAKWYGKTRHVFYEDNRNSKDLEDDKQLLQGIWKLLDECDIVITQNGKAFDVKKLNARFLVHGMQPPSSYRHIDVMLLIKKHFAMSSNKLEYTTGKLCKRYKKLKVKKFQGFDLWKECIRGNTKAWNEMRRYNKYDVLSLEELYDVVKAWDNTINFNVYQDTLSTVCSCGGSYRNKGYSYTSTGKFARYRCKECGNELRGKTNLLSPEKKDSLKKGTI